MRIETPLEAIVRVSNMDALKYRTDAALPSLEAPSPDFTRSRELLSDIRIMYGEGHPLVLELADEYEIAVAQGLKAEATIHRLTKGNS